MIAFALYLNFIPHFFIYSECTKRKVDLVFLIDGSESLKAEDFKKNKEFIAEIMKMLSNTSIQVDTLYCILFHTGIGQISGNTDMILL